MDMEGIVLGNRYELLEKVGAGGMASVYKAKCRLLNRFVAVKILREEFTNDAEFLARFKVEAQAAASLSHPNIISVYDVGNQDNINYIVMEYVQGQTLKDYVLEKGPLPWKLAINITLQICSALEHAHTNKIIHHDIKPHNIMLTQGMVTKVMDFGIARAVTSSTLTTASNTIGSVHYFSPEQARGGYTDEKSDLYSVGIVFYEMLTGKVPFDAETPVAVALKHLEDEIQEPKKLNPNIPNSVNKIVVKATRKNKSDRYFNAKEMIRDLYNALESPEIMPINDNDLRAKQVTQQFDVVKDYDSKIDMDKAKMEYGEIINDKEIFPKDRKKKTKANNKVVLAAIITGVLVFPLLLTGIAFIIFRYLSGSDVTEIDVPDIVGIQFEQAKANLQTQGIIVELESFTTNSEYEQGEIISQEPTVGNVMKSSGKIKVVVSAGKGEVKVPDLVNMELKEAKYKLEELELVPVIINEYSNEYPKGVIFKQAPLSSYMVSKGSEIELYISSGPAPKVKVPNFKGLTEAEAKQEIENQKLILGDVEYIQDKNTKVGVVVSQSIYQGTTVEEGTSIVITINNYDATSQQTAVTPPPEVQKEVTKNLLIDLESTKDVINKGLNEEFVLKVETEGTEGKKLVYAKVHTKADKEVIVPITAVGSVFVKVYIDDNLNSEKTYEF